MSFYIDVQSNSVVVNNGPIQTATDWKYTSKMDRAGSFSFSIPARDEKLAFIRKKRTVHAYAHLSGFWQEVGAGIIDDIEYEHKNTGIVMVNVSGYDLLTELRKTSVGFLQIGAESAPVTYSEAVVAIMNYAPSGWNFYPSFDAETNELYVRFAGESVLAALISVSKKAKMHFWRGPGRNLFFAKTFSPSGIRAIANPDALSVNTCAINSLSFKSSTSDYVNEIHPYGSGQGEARLTLASTNRVAPSGYSFSPSGNYIRFDQGVTDNGVWIEHLEYKDIGLLSNTDADYQSAANQLFDVALLDLQSRSNDNKVHYELDVSKVPRLLHPCETIRVSYNDPAANISINEELKILGVEWSIQDDVVTTSTLELSNVDEWTTTDTDIIVGKIKQGNTFSAYPQTNANAYWVAYRVFVGENQSNDKATIPVILGNEVVTVSQVKFRVKISPVQTFVGTAAGSTDVSLTATGTIDIPSHAHEVPDHVHEVSASQGSGGRNVGLYTGGGLYYEGSDAGVVSFNTTSSGGTTSEEEGDQTDLELDVGGSIDLSDAIETIFGMTQVSGALTFANTDLEWSIDNATWTLLSAGTVVGDYLEFDVTDKISDLTTFRPTAEISSLVFRRNGGGTLATPPDEMTAMLDVLVGIRTTIQAINYT